MSYSPPPGATKTARYVGDGTTGQSVATTFQPKFVMIMGDPQDASKQATTYFIQITADGMTIFGTAIHVSSVILLNASGGFAYADPTHIYVGQIAASLNNSFGAGEDLNGLGHNFTVLALG